MATISLTISAVLAIIVGLLILIWPKFLRIAVGLYFLIFGVLNLVEF